MAIEWFGDVNGTDIFPKLPVYHLRSYYTTFQRNARVRDAVRNAASGEETLRVLSAATLAACITAAPPVAVQLTAPPAVMQIDADDTLPPPPPPPPRPLAAVMPRAALPMPLVHGPSPFAPILLPPRRCHGSHAASSTRLAWALALLRSAASVARATVQL